MGWLDAIITGSFGAAQQGAQMAFDANQAELNRDFQSEEAEKNRVFQSGEAALQRDWSSQEAERARDWNEEMYEKYNSLSGKVAQAEAAGVNPMFAVTGNAVSPMSTNASAPTGASAGSVGTPAGDSATMKFVDIIGQIMGVKKAKAEIDLMKSEESRNYSDSEYTQWLSKLSEREYNIVTENNFDIQEIQSRISLNIDQASAAFELAGKYMEEAASIASERDFFEKTKDDKVKMVEYDRIMAEFEKSLPDVIDSLGDGQKQELSDWVGSILKLFLYIK